MIEAKLSHQCRSIHAPRIRVVLQDWRVRGVSFSEERDGRWWQRLLGADVTFRIDAPESAAGALRQAIDRECGEIEAEEAW